MDLLMAQSVALCPETQGLGGQWHLEGSSGPTANFTDKVSLSKGILINVMDF